MEAMVDATFGRNESYAEADAGKYSQIRLWQTPWRPRTNATYILPPMGQGGRPQTINWLSPSNTSLQDFSAVCWYYGKSLADQPALAGVPIGLMGTFVGGTFIEQWIRQEKQGACTETLCGTKDLDGFKCGTLYNGQIAPVVNTTIAGVVWYQVTLSSLPAFPFASGRRTSGSSLNITSASPFRRARGRGVGGEQRPECCGKHRKPDRVRLPDGVDDRGLAVHLECCPKHH